MRPVLLAAPLLLGGCGRILYGGGAVDAGLDAASAPFDASLDAGSSIPFDAPLLDAPLLDAPLLDAPLLDAPLLDAPLLDALLLDAPLLDAFVEDDAFVPAVDAFVPPVDAFVPADAFSPDAALPPDRFVEVAVGQTAVCVRLAGGAVQCAGTNVDGILGIGSTMRVSVSRLAPVPGITGASELRLGDSHALVATDVGLFAWGWNQDGALGTGSATPATSPSPVPSTVFGSVRRLAPSRTSTCAILADRTLACVGDNFFGQLGDGTRTDSVTPRVVPGLTAVTDVAGSEGHYCAVHDGGRVSCWGWGTSGQLGNGDTTTYQPSPVSTGITDAIAIGVGQSHTCAVRADRSLWCWGANDSGQLGDGTTMYRSVPAIVPGLDGVAEVAGGYVHTCARLVDGRVFCFGWNAYGQLGDGTTMDRLVPTLVMAPPTAVQIAVNNGAELSCALHSDGRIFCWGDNGTGAFGVGTTGTVPIPVAMLPSPS